MINSFTHMKVDHDRFIAELIGAVVDSVATIDDDLSAIFLSILMDFLELCISLLMYFFDFPLMWSIIKRLTMKTKLRPKTSQTIVNAW